APSFAVTSHVLKHSFQFGQPLLGQGKTGAQLGRCFDGSRERVDSRRLGAINVSTAAFPANSRPEIARASIVLPRPVSRAACSSESVVMWPPVSSECSTGSRDAPRDPSRDGAHEMVNDW